MDKDDRLNKFLMNLAKGGSDNFIKFVEAMGANFEGLEKIDLGRKLVEEQFGFNEKEFLAVDFVFWIAYAVERNAKDLIVYPEVGVGIRTEFVEYLYSLLSKHKKEELNSQFITMRDTSLEPSIRKESIEYVIDTLTLGAKIMVIEKFYSSEENFSFIDLMKEVLRLRNDIAHGRVSNLTYKSFPLSSGKGQVALFTDLLHVMT